MLLAALGDWPYAPSLQSQTATSVPPLASEGTAILLASALVFRTDNPCVAGPGAWLFFGFVLLQQFNDFGVPSLLG